MKVLVVVDMQKDFISGVLGNAETMAAVPAVVRKIEEYANIDDSFVYFTLDTHGENYMDTQEGRRLPVPHCIENTDGWQLESEIEAAGKHLTRVKNIEKPAFGTMKLADEISRVFSDDMTIELVGVCTDICVISNAMILKAAFPETEIIVDSRCCAGVTPESHERALKAMEACQITVLY